MPNSRKPRRPGSLLSPEASGGISAGLGFDFQLRYAACHLPIWLKHGHFRQLLFEGTGDIDVRFDGGGASSRIHIQVKDHEIAPAELKLVLKQFQDIDSGMPGVYERFTLACPSLSPNLRPVESGLARLRGGKAFYDDVPQALTNTQLDFDQRLRKVGLQDFSDFIQARVFIEVSHGDLRHDDRAIELFIARLLEHPEYAGRLRAMVEPAFGELMRAISARRGVVLDRADIEKILQDAVRGGDAERKGVTIWIQNWTNETFDRQADYVLDWSPHFDRATRRVPSKETWNSELVPALRGLQKQIATDRKERVIRFRGRCALSTGIALGAIFPAVGGWTFEIPQPPSTDTWNSDAEATPGYKIRTELVDGAETGTDLVLGLNIKGDGRGDVTRYVEGMALRPRLYAFVSPASQGPQAIAGGQDARAFALAVRNVLGELLKKHGLVRTHIFFYGPLALAIILGQQLTSIGEVQLYEYQDPSYVPSCTLRT